MKIQHFRFSAMASPCQLHLLGDSTQCRRAATAVEQEVRRIEQKYSRYRDDSVLSELNQRAGQTCDIDAETAYLLNYARACWQQSDGLFDISSGVLRRQWDFRNARLPDPQQLQTLLPRVGFDRCQLQQHNEQHQLLMPAEMEIDFGGIGKEYAADRAAALCRQHGIHSGVVDLGGDLLVLGPKPDGSPWLLGVRHPRDPDKAFAQLPVYEGGMASSGDYERYFDHQGRRYCHLLNPSSGWPVDYWASVTVLAPSCLLAGSFSTIAMLKQQQAQDWLQQQGLHFLAIRPDGSHIRQRNDRRQRS